MDKVKTYVVGLANGYEDSFKKLDDLVKNLGHIEIKCIRDQLMQPTTSSDYNLARTIVYRKVYGHYGVTKEEGR
jgi:hypothetical protein